MFVFLILFYFILIDEFISRVFFVPSMNGLDFRLLGTFVKVRLHYYIENFGIENSVPKIEIFLMYSNNLILLQCHLELIN